MLLGIFVKNFKCYQGRHFIPCFSVDGSNNFGGIVGSFRSGTVSNSFSSASVDGGLNVGGAFGELFGGTIDSVQATGNVTSNRSEYVVMKTGYNAGGFVGYLVGATITNSYATGNVSSSGWYAGGFAGQSAAATITNSYATGNVTPFSEDTGWVMTPNYIGGFVGSSSNTNYTKVFATGNVGSSESIVVGGFVGLSGLDTFSNVYATGNAIGDSVVGGFVGQTGSASVFGSTYSSGSVTGNSYAAPFLGYDDSGEVSITNSFYDSTRAGAADNGFATGKSTTDMKKESMFRDAGWDFDTVWALDDEANQGYPTFAFMLTPRVISVTPGNSATNVSKSSAITALFSLPMNPDTFEYSVDSCGDGCTFTPAWSNGNRLLTLTKSGDLPYATTVHVSIEAGQDAITGHLLSGTPYQWSFTTENAPAAAPTYQGGYVSGGSSWASKLPTLQQSAAAIKVPQEFKLSEKAGASPGKKAVSSKTLKFGSKGPAVKALQVFLNANGFPIAPSGPGSKGKETGSFGKKTKLALMAYQKARGLKADGAAGPKTLALIAKESGKTN